MGGAPLVMGARGRGTATRLRARARKHARGHPAPAPLPLIPPPPPTHPPPSQCSPSSLHYFEGDASLRQGRAAFPQPPLALAGGVGWVGCSGGRRVVRCGCFAGLGRTLPPPIALTPLPQPPPTPPHPHPHPDPEGRCAALLLYRHQLAVLPAVASEAAALGMAPGDEGGGAPAAAALGNSYVDDLGRAGIKEVSVGCLGVCGCVCGWGWRVGVGLRAWGGGGVERQGGGGGIAACVLAQRLPWTQLTHTHTRTRTAPPPPTPPGAGRCVSAWGCRACAGASARG